VRKKSLNRFARPTKTYTPTIEQLRPVTAFM
jgi:hypothetical protein